LTAAELIDRPRPWIAKYHPVDGGCCDAAKRMSDVITLHAIAGQAGQYCLIRLIDGGQPDGHGIYPSREAAEPHKTHPAQIAILIPPGGTAAAQCEEVLHYHRELYDQLGSRPLEIGYLQPLTRRDQRRQIQILRRSK
jgi:hypothetical protein